VGRVFVWRGHVLRRANIDRSLDLNPRLRGFQPIGLRRNVLAR